MAEQALNVLLSQGTLGLVAALFIGLYLKELSENKVTRNAHTAELRALLEQAAKEQQELSARNEYRTKELHESYQAELRELYEQIHALREAHAERERTALQTIEYFARQTVEAVEELAKVGELLRRAYERARRQ